MVEPNLNGAMQTEHVEQRPPTRHRGRGCLVALLAAMVLVVGVIYMVRRPMPAVTSVRLKEARERWRVHGPTAYRIRVRVTGRQPARYEVEVRNGEVTSATRNGQPLKQQRTLGTWSVPGMFGTIQLDVDALDRVRNGPQAANQPFLTLRAQFHPDYGYPARYHRIETASGGSNPEVVWEVEQFDILRD